MPGRHPGLRPTLLTVCVIGVSALWAPAPADTPATLEGALDDASVLSLASEGHAARDTSIAIGHMEISIADAVAVPVLGKSGAMLGLYLEGNGGWRYTAEDPADRETFLTNVSRVARDLTPVGGALSNRFTKLLILFTRPSFPELWDPAAGGAPAQPVPGSFASGFADARDGAMASFPEFDFRLAEARLNGRGSWTYTEIVGGVERLGHLYDDIRSGREGLYNFRKFNDLDVRSVQTLSNQPIPGWDAERRNWLQLTHIDVDMATEDNRSGTIGTTLTFRVRGRQRRLLPLNLDSTYDPDRRSWASPKYRLEVHTVVDDMGHELPFSHKYGELLVEISSTGVDESTVTIQCDTGGEIFLDAYGRHGSNYFDFDSTNWYPSPSGWMGERFTYSIKVKCKKPWVPIASGRQDSLKEDGPYNVLVSSSDRPSHLIGIVAGKYVTREEIVGGLTVRVHAYSGAMKFAMNELPKRAAAIAKFYESLLGPLPTEELEIVEVPAWGMNVAPAGLVLVEELPQRGIDATLAHEIAHQWFGHEEMPAEPSENWLAESFAEYFSGLAASALASNRSRQWALPQMLIDWRGDEKLCADVASISTANYLGGEHAEVERACLLYSRGPLVLHMLRSMLGNDQFFASVRLFLKRADYGPATTDDLAIAVSQTFGRDMRWYFDQWIDRSGNPTVHVDDHVAAGQNGTYRLYGSVHEDAGPRFKQLVIPLVFNLDGKPDARLVILDAPDKTFDFSLSGKPSSVKVDPFQNNIAVYK